MVSHNTAAGVPLLDDSTGDTVESECGGTASAPLKAVFFIMGVGALLPWNAFLSALDFYALVFPDTPQIVQYITASYFFPMYFTSLFLVFTPAVTPGNNVTVPLCFALFAAIAVALSVLAPSSAQDRERLAKTTTLAAASVLGMGSSFAQGTLFGLASLFPSGECSRAFNSGGGMAGIVIIVLRIATRLVFSPASTASSTVNELASVRIFFFVCAAMCGLCVCVFLAMEKYSPEYTHRVRIAALAGDAEPQAMTLSNYMRETALIMRNSGGMALCLCTSYTVTAALFPGIFIELQTAGNGLFSGQSSGWFPLVVVLLFAVGDTFGKSVPSRLVTGRPGLVKRLTLARVASAPLGLAVWLRAIRASDTVVLLAAFVHGLGNGVVSTGALIIGPQQVPLQHREAAGRVMYIMLISGLAIGTLLGLVLTQYLRAFRTA